MPINDKLIKKLSEKLGHPNFDPHGDPIPDEKGKIQKSNFWERRLSYLWF